MSSPFLFVSQVNLSGLSPLEPQCLDLENGEENSQLLSPALGLVSVGESCRCVGATPVTDKRPPRWGWPVCNAHLGSPKASLTCLPLCVPPDEEHLEVTTGCPSSTIGQDTPFRSQVRGSFGVI